MVMYAVCCLMFVHNEASRAFAVYVGQQLDITKFSTDPEAVKKANDRVPCSLQLLKHI